MKYRDQEVTKIPMKSADIPGEPLSVAAECKKGCEPSRVQSESSGCENSQARLSRMECCDCGLVHIMNFRIPARKIQFRAKREQICRIDRNCWQRGAAVTDELLTRTHCLLRHLDWDGTRRISQFAAPL